MTNNTAASITSDNDAVDDNDDINSIRTRRATKILDGLVDHPIIPGIQYMIVTAESILFDYSGGIRDAATLKEVTKTTTFLSSSTTKVLTATAILKLVEQGKIGSLDDPLSKYYKEHPYDNNNNDNNDNTVIQIQHLLNQSSGIPNPLPLAWLHTCEDHNQNGGYKENEALAVVLKDNSQLDFPPGEKYQYSNLSYWLLGKVIEQASGMSYRQYMKKEIFDPLNIQEAELDTEIHNDSDSGSEYYARGHLPRYSIFTLVFWFLVPNWLWDTSSGYWARLRVLYMNGPAYGGMVASANGYAKFLQDILKIIKTQQQQQQQQQHSIKTDDNDNNYSSSSSSVLFSKEEIRNLIFNEQYDTSGRLLPTTLGGWHRGKLKNNNDKHDDNISYDYFSKPGGGPGYSSNIRIYPTLGIASIYLCNKAEASETPINSLSDLIDIEFLSPSPPIAAAS